MKKKNVSKKPPAKVEKVAPAGVSKKKKSSKNGLNIHSVGNIWTPPSSGKDKILNSKLNIFFFNKKIFIYTNNSSKLHLT